MKNPADMTDREIRNEIFAEQSSPAREKALAEELVRRGQLNRAPRQVDVNASNEEH